MRCSLVVLLDEVGEGVLEGTGREVSEWDASVASMVPPRRFTTISRGTQLAFRDDGGSDERRKRSTSGRRGRSVRRLRQVSHRHSHGPEERTPFFKR